MTPEQFWYEEPELINSYITSYLRKTKYEAWINGFYSYQANAIALANAFKEKGSKAIEYPQYDELDFIKEENESIPEDDNDYKYLSQCY